MRSPGKTTALIITLVSLVSLGYAVLLLKSLKIAVALYVLGVGLLTLLIEPFIGLANYLVFLYLRPQEFLPGFVGFPVMLVVGGATFMVIILHDALVKKNLHLRGAPQNILMILFLAAIILSHMSHLYMHGALDSARQFTSTLVMYLLIVNLATSERKLTITSTLLMLLTVFLAGQGIKQFLTGTGMAGQTLVEGRIRAIGIFSDPNDLALTFLVVLPFAVLTILQSKRLLLKLASAMVTVVLIYGLYLTGSRGGFLSLGILFFFIFTRRYGLSAGLIVGALMFFAIFAFGPSRMEDLSPSEASAYGRIEAWGAGMDMLKSNLLFGVGAGRFMDFHFRTAHNSFVLCASELGLYGLYVWMLLIFVSMKNMLYVCSESRSRGYGSVAIMSESVFLAFVGFLGAAFFLSRTYNELLFVLIGLSAALTNVFVAKTGQQYQLMERKDLLVNLAIVLLLLVILKLILVLFW